MDEEKRGGARRRGYGLMGYRDQAVWLALQVEMNGLQIEEKKTDEKMG